MNARPREAREMFDITDFFLRLGGWDAYEVGNLTDEQLMYIKQMTVAYNQAVVQAKEADRAGKLRDDGASDRPNV